MVLTSVAFVVVAVVVVVVDIILLVSAVRVVLIARAGILDGADTTLLVSAVRVVLITGDGILDGADTTVDNILLIEDVVTTGDVVGVVTIEVEDLNIFADITVGNKSGTCIDGICIGGRVTLVDVMTALTSILDVLLISRISNLFCIPDGIGNFSRWLPPVDDSSSSWRAARVTVMLL